jgi:hypothetical protein
MRIGRIAPLVLVCATSAALASAADKPHAGQAVRGELVSRTATTLVVRPEGQQETRQYSIPPLSAMDAKTATFFRNLAAGSLVQVTAVHGQSSRSMDVLLLAGPGKFGLLEGTVAAKAPLADPKKLPDWVEIKDDKGDSKRYTPVWTGKAFDPEMAKAISQRTVGDRVEIRWVEDDHRRVKTMRVLATAPQTAADDAGLIVGRVVDKGKDWLTIESDGGEKNRYVPQPVVGTNGELDKEVQRNMSRVKVGRRVEGLWFDDGERRLYLLKPMAEDKTR